MSLSNYERCKAWIANKPNVEAVRDKLAILEEKLLAIAVSHPKRKDFENTMQVLLTHLQKIDNSAKNISLSKTDVGTTKSGLAYDVDPTIQPIIDPIAKRAAVELLKLKIGCGVDFIKRKQLVA
ncbi:MAG: hypothetical protein ACI87J_002257 [Colwellia sp.]|jgi:hypothetical protein